MNKSDTAKKQLLDHICSEKLSIGASLPSEHQLASMLEVSRATVRTALKRLHEDGSIIPGETRGWQGAAGTGAGTGLGKPVVRASLLGQFAMWLLNALRRERSIRGHASNMSCLLFTHILCD